MSETLDQPLVLVEKVESSVVTTTETQVVALYGEVVSPVTILEQGIVAVEVPVPGERVVEYVQTPPTNPDQEQQHVVVGEERWFVVTTGEQGPPGKSAPVGGISSDPNNVITNGGDGGLFAPDALPTDPIAYYILARS